TSAIPPAAAFSMNVRSADVRPASLELFVALLVFAIFELVFAIAEFVTPVLALLFSFPEHPARARAIDIVPANKKIRRISKFLSTFDGPPLVAFTQKQMCLAITRLRTQKRTTTVLK